MTDAIVSIGTNSTRVLVANISKTLALYANSIGTRIGEGLREKGELNEIAMQRTLDAVREHREAIKPFQPQKTFAIATSAMRRASNADIFAAKVEKVLGVPLQVLSGEEEALASYRGAISSIHTDGAHIGVVDIGGGSTEYAVGVHSVPQHITSCEIGAVRLTEIYPELNGTHIAPESAIERAYTLAQTLLQTIKDFPRVDKLLAVGGTASTAASIMRHRLQPFDRYTIDHYHLKALLKKLCNRTLKRRKKMRGMKPQRADILPAGLIILEAILELTNHTKATATTSDLLLGYLLTHTGANSEKTGNRAV